MPCCKDRESEPPVTMTNRDGERCCPSVFYPYPLDRYVDKEDLDVQDLNRGAVGPVEQPRVDLLLGATSGL